MEGPESMNKGGIEGWKGRNRRMEGRNGRLEGWKAGIEGWKGRNRRMEGRNGRLEGWKAGIEGWKGGGRQTFGFEAEVALAAGVGAEVRVRADVFLEHGWLLAADAALLAHVAAAPSSAHVGVLFVRLESAGEYPHSLPAHRIAASASHRAARTPRGRLFRLSHDRVCIRQRR